MARKKENKRSDGYYEVKCVVDHTFDGKPIYKSFYSRKSKNDARSKADEYKRKKAADGDRSYKKFVDVLQEVMEIKKEQVRESTYYVKWENASNDVIDFFGASYIEAITKDDLNRFFKERKEYKKSTLNNKLSILKETFRYAKDNDYIRDNICENYKMEYGKKSEDRHVFTPEQADLCIEFCKNHKYGLPVYLMLSYGMSRSELLGITMEAIDYKNKTIAIVQSVSIRGLEKTKNKFRNRLVAVSDETLEIIKNTGYTSGFLFKGRNGNPKSLSAITKSVKRIMTQFQEECKSKGIDVPVLSPHELRHTRATIWVNEGRNLFAIAQQMGWSDLDMLRKRYAHADIQELRKELDI